MTKKAFQLLRDERLIAANLVSHLMLAESQAVAAFDEAHKWEKDPYNEPHIAALGIALQAAIDHRDALVDRVRVARKELYPGVGHCDPSLH